MKTKLNQYLKIDTKIKKMLNTTVCFRKDILICYQICNK